MSQDQPSAQRQRDAQDAAAQPRAFVGPIPNMLPYNAARASAFETSPFLSFLPPTQGLSVQNPLSGYTSFSEFSFPFPDQYTPLSPSRMAAAASLNASIGYPRANPEAHFKSPKERNQHALAHELLPIFSTESPALPGHKRSRLPSNDVARKAPRKSTASSPLQNSATRSSAGKPVKARGRPTKQNSRSRQDSPSLSQPTPIAKNRVGRPAKLTASTRKDTQVGDDHVAPLTLARSRPVVLDDDDEDDVDIPPRAAAETYKTNTSYFNPTSTDDASITQKAVQLRPRPRRPRPQYDYPVPEEMEGIYHALGEDNWNEYLVLIEKERMGVIMEEQVAMESKHLFSVFDESTRRRMERQMTDKVVLPVMQQVKEERERQKLGQVRTTRSRPL